MRAQVLAAGVVASLLAGCGPAVTPPVPAWQRVTLPGVRPASLAAAGAELLVGGRSADTPGPRLVRLRSGSVAGEFDLRPADPNAEAADLLHLTVAGDDVYAIGSMIAGAHSNPRLTMWNGTLGEARITSHTQEFFTFGGHDAGPLLGTVVVGGSPVIFGSRVGATGTYGLLWTRSGHTWTQQRPEPALTSVTDREFGFGALAQLGDRLVVAGDELGLAGGLLQQPVVFIGTVAGEWRDVALPVPAALGRVPGQLSVATSVACRPAGGTCWVAGWVRGHVLAWQVRIPASGDAAPDVPVTLPGEPPAGNNPVALVTWVGEQPAVLTNATSPSLQVGCADGWRGLPAPPGAATALLGMPDGLYAVAADGLWRLAAPSC